MYSIQETSIRTSTFVAFNARVYSLARSKGCISGARFLGALITLDPGACAEAADRLRAFIFMALGWKKDQLTGAVER